MRFDKSLKFHIIFGMSVESHVWIPVKCVYIPLSL